MLLNNQVDKRLIYGIDKKRPFWKRNTQLMVAIISLAILILGIFQRLNPNAALGMMGTGEILPVAAHYFAMVDFVKAWKS